jgi:hypothetical protein
MCTVAASLSSAHLQYSLTLIMMTSPRTCFQDLSQLIFTVLYCLYLKQFPQQYDLIFSVYCIRSRNFRYIHFGNMNAHKYQFTLHQYSFSCKIYACFYLNFIKDTPYVNYLSIKCVLVKDIGAVCVN